MQKPDKTDLWVGIPMAAGGLAAIATSVSYVGLAWALAIAVSAGLSVAGICLLVDYSKEARKARRPGASDG